METQITMAPLRVCSSGDEKKNNQPTNQPNKNQERNIHIDFNGLMPVHIS